MSWEHREYAQSGPWRDGPRFAGVALPRGAARWLIAAHALAFFVLLFLRSAGDTNARTSPGAAAEDREPASVLEPYISGIGAHSPPRPLTVLLHPYTPGPDRVLSGFFVVLFTCFVISSLGALVEERLGSARMLLLYLLGNTCAGAVYLAAVIVAPLLARAPLDHPLGAFAAWSLWAMRSMRFEHASVFGRMYSISRIVAVIAGIIIILEMLGRGLGAALWVLALAVGSLPALFLPPLEQFVQARRGRVMRRAPRRPPAGAVESERSRRPVASEPSARAADDLDELLAKISRYGIDSLTDAERARLEEARRARLSRSDQP